MSLLMNEKGPISPTNPQDTKTTITGSSAVGGADANLNDAADLTGGITKGLYLGGAGDVVVTLANMANGTSITLTGLSAGMIHPIAAKRIWATGTTATGIVALY